MTTSHQDEKFIEAVISSTLLEEAIEWIRNNMEPGDVFDEEALKEWAESNGFTAES